jgi:transcriptional regulator GlxA family with amidase domain
VSFCSGAFALAEAGVLDGRPAATHWLFADELRARFPRIDVRSDVLYVDDGQVLTSAGTAAAVDLSLHLVALDHGAAVANSIARRMVVPPHREGGQAQFMDAPAALADEHRLAGTLEWAASRLDEQITVDELARHAHLSPRTFARRFQEATGTTPLRWLSHLRVRAARELLESSDLPVDVIAQRCGLGSAANLRLHLRRALGVTPTAYRLTFGR